MINYCFKSRTNRDIYTLHYALVQAHRHTSGGSQDIWAVATDSRNNIIVEAGNDYNDSHYLQRHYSKQCGCNYRNNTHAEISVISKLMRSGKKADKIFVARADSRLRPLLAKPCEICAFALTDIKLKKVFWTLSHNQYKEKDSIWKPDTLLK